MQQLFFGDECISGVRELTGANKWDRILLVTGKGSYEASGAEKFISDCFLGQEAEIFRFCDFESNPNIKDLKKGIGIVRGFLPSVIVAIGGGSVLDMAKLLRFFLTHDGEILGNEYTATDKKIPLIAVPTTAGTGAEATHFAVLYDDSGKKHSIADHSILPDYAVVYPPLTYGLSPYVTAYTGFDALAQAIEAYWNKNATPESDEYALKAMNLIYGSLPVAVHDPAGRVRDKMAEGAYWAGRAINITKTTAPHAFSYPFTSLYGIPHGHAVSIVFPKIAELNLLKGDIPNFKKQILLSFFAKYGKVEDSLNKYISDIGLYIPSKEYDLGSILKGISIERLANNPSKISDEEAICIIKEISNSRN